MTWALQTLGGRRLLIKSPPRLRSQEKSLVSKTGFNGLVARGPGLVEHLDPPEKGQHCTCELLIFGDTFYLFSSSICCRLGCPGFTLPEFKPSPVEGGASKSLFFPDEAINKHPRFR